MLCSSYKYSYGSFLFDNLHLLHCLPKVVWKGIRVIIQLALLSIPHSLFNSKSSLFNTKPSIFNYHYADLDCKYLSFH